jgi:hypothetical protein
MAFLEVIDLSDIVLLTPGGLAFGCWFVEFGMFECRHTSCVHLLDFRAQVPVRPPVRELTGVTVPEGERGE